MIDPSDEPETEGMDDEELESIVSAEVTDAVAFIDTDIGPMRAEAISLYRGDALGNEEEGRSQFVSRDVADTISAITPSLMRVFFGPEHVVEFIPEREEDEAVAAQQTDYINYIVTRDNPGFEIFYAAIKDALRSKVGFIKWWWDDSIEVTTKLYTGLDDDSVTKLLDDLQAETTLEAEILSAEDRSDGTKDVKLKIKRRVDRARIEAVPPEEFLINRDAKSIDTARFCGHRRDMTVSDLVALGYDRELVEEHSGQEDDLSYSAERQARMPYARRIGSDSGSSDPSTKIVRYVEGYVLADTDGDGIAELIKVCLIGEKLVHHEPADERCFADFHCDPEPHAFFGESMADKTRDIQYLKSSLIRSGLDSLASAIFPRTVIGRGVNTDDAQNNEVGSITRAEDVDQVKVLTTPDVSPAALNWLGYADDVRENRTGMSKVSMGLDAEALQNTTATAAEGQFSRSQERIELIARIMASGFRRLFRGLSHLVAANQRQERVLKLRNQWTAIDPRAWRSDMDVQPNVGLGGGSDAHKAGVLSQVMQTQAAIFTQYGLQNPFVTVPKYLETCGTFLEVAGFKQPDKFFNSPEEAEQIMQQQAAAQAGQPPPKDPKLVEVEAKAALSAQEAEAKHGLAVQEADRGAELSRYKAELDAQVAAERAQGELALKEATAAAEMALKERLLVAEMDLKERQMAAEADLRERQAEHNAQMTERKVSSDIGEVSPGGEPG